MKVRFEPNKNLEARLIRQSFKGREEMRAGEICNHLSLDMSDLSEIICRLQDYQLVDCHDWPLSIDSKLSLNEHDLIVGNEYDILLIAYGSYRILSEGAGHDSKPEPYQFHRELFVVTDKQIPDNWIAEWVDGELSIHPPGWDNSLFCDFFEQKAGRRKQFIKELEIYFPATYKRWINHESNNKYQQKSPNNLLHGCAKSRAQ